MWELQKFRLYIYIDFKGDAEVIIKALLAMDTNRPKNGRVLNDAILLADYFHFCIFSHVKHLGNSIAHFLTKTAKSGTKLQVWVKSTPDDISSLVTHDSVQLFSAFSFNKLAL